MRDIWLAYGQSNCTGKVVDEADYDLFASIPSDVQFQIWQHNATEKLTPTWWEVLRYVPVGYFGWCSALEIVRDQRAAGAFPVLLKYAQNGAPLYTVLRPTASAAWGNACAWWLTEIAKLSSPYWVRGLVWVGCEGDAPDLTRVAAIPEGLEEIETYLLAALDGASIRVHPDGLTWVLQSLHPDMDRTYVTEANAQYQAFCAAASNRRIYADVTRIESPLQDDGDPGPDDDVHYSSTSYHGVDGVGDTVSTAVLNHMGL